MSFEAQDASLSAGRPLQLYLFRRGVLLWAYASGDRAVVWNSITFKHLAGGISSDGARRTGEISADRLKVTAPADLEVAQLYRNMPPSSEIRLTIYDYQIGTEQAVAAWDGLIEWVNWPALDRCEIVALPLTASLDVPGLRNTWDPNCGASLFDRRCKVNRDLWRVELTIQSLTGTTISSAMAAGFANGHFAGGFIEWPVGGGEYDRRTIEHHQGSVLTLMGGTAGLSLAQTLRVYPGCDRTAATCHYKYSNLDNMRADPNMMAKNIFNGNPVF